ncbi:MAG: TonB-dependent receptor [Pseudomonadota bacterium]
MKLLLQGASALALVGANAAAQDATGADVAVDDTIIVISTQKRDQSSLEVPINVTAYSGDFLETIGVQQFDELADFVPGLEIQEQSPNNPGFVIRGITSDSGEANIEPRVSVYQDGVSISRSRGSYVELFDVERVEVAKGPQATLFGRGGLIGAINIVQAKASQEFSASFGAEVGNLGYDMVEGHINGAIIPDVLAGRIAFRHKTRDGYVENALGGTDFNSQEVAAIRGALRFTPNEQFTADLIANYQEDTPAATAFKSGTFLPTPDGSLEPGEPAALNTFGGFVGRDLGLEREVYGVTLLADYQISDAYTLSSVSAWREFNSFESFDPDGFALPLFVFGEGAEGLQYSQELRLLFDDGGKVSWFVGANYFFEEGEQDVPLQYDERAVQALLAGLLVPPNAPPVEAFPNFNANPLSPLFGQPLKPIHQEIFGNTGETSSFDVYGDVTFRVTDRLEIIGGLRYTYDDKTAGGFAELPDGVSQLTGGGIFVTNAVPGVTSAETSNTFDGLSWRAVAQYAVTDDVNIFASHARGRNSDILSVNAGSGPGVFDFETIPAETVDSYEVGAKGLLLGGALIAEGSAFYYEYSNFQTTILNPLTGLAEAINAGNATSYGFEGQVIARPSDFAQIFATYAYNNSRFDDTDDDGNPQEFADNRFRLSPDHSFSIGAILSYPLPTGSLEFTPTYVWQSEIFFDNDNDNDLADGDTSANADERQEAYGLLDLRLAYEDADGRYSVFAFANNVLDEEYIIDAGNTGDAFGIPTFIAGEPRIYGGGVRVRF